MEITVYLYIYNLGHRTYFMFGPMSRRSTWSVEVNRIVLALLSRHGLFRAVSLALGRPTGAGCTRLPSDCLGKRVRNAGLGTNSFKTTRPHFALRNNFRVKSVLHFLTHFSSQTFQFASLHGFIHHYSFLLESSRSRLASTCH